MPVPLPNLDDRRWSELLEEGRALIPIYERSWTDHNVHDPGMMLVELLAWVTEMDIYWLNRIPESHLRKFLSLAGFTPAPPIPARSVLQIELQDSASPLKLPKDLTFEGTDAYGQRTAFRAMRAITAVPGKIVALLSNDDSGWSDLTARFTRGDQLLPFGNNPQVGSTMLIGLSQPLPINVPVSLYFSFAGERSGLEERNRLHESELERANRCRTPKELIECLIEEDVTEDDECQAEQDCSMCNLVHHSVRLDWEYLDAVGQWQPLDRQAGQIADETRSLTLDGLVDVTVPEPMGWLPLGEPERILYWLRGRMASGSYDAPPSVAGLAFNGVAVEQAANVGVQTWLIANDAEVYGPEPSPGESVGVRQLEVTTAGVVTKLEFAPQVPPGIPLLKYRPPEHDQPGQISLQCEALEAGNGRPFQRRTLMHPAIDAGSLEVLTFERGCWNFWQSRVDLDASGPADTHFILDASSGELQFGDGRRGRTLPSGALALASYRTTRGEPGNLPAGKISSLSDSSHNRALIDDFPSLSDIIEVISNPLPAIGGAAAESVDDAVARMRAELDRPRRAVTPDDIRFLAFETPGVHLSRVAVIPNLHPAYPCLKAPGVVTVIVLPWLPLGQPMPSRGLLGRVRAHLTPRRVIGTRLIVVGPRYTALSVRAQVKAHAAVDQVELRDRIEATLERFFDPLVGGPSGEGWPFGRDVYRAEVLSVIDNTTGVDHVLALDFTDADGNPGCANVCVGPLSLVCAREHQIEVS